MEVVKCLTPEAKKNSLVLSHIHKEYRSKVVIKDFSYTFKKGHVYLLTDGNGYGKSTLIKIICGLIKGEGDVNFYEHHISYIPEKINLPSLMNSDDFLECLGEIKGIKEQECHRRILELTQFFDFNEGLHKPMKALSKGMRQKVFLIGAFLREEEIYIFDEPLNGLDEQAVHQFLTLIQEYKKRNATFIIVTHEAGVYAGLYDDIIHLD